MEREMARKPRLPPGIDLLPSGEYRARAMDANGRRRAIVSPVLADATRWLDQQRAARARARAGLEEPQPIQSGQTLGQLIDQFRAVAESAYASEVAGHFLDKWKRWLGARRLASLRDTDIIAWRDQRYAEGKSPATIDRELSALKGIYRWARANRMHIPNPAAGITSSRGVGVRVKPEKRRPARGAIERTRAAILKRLDPVVAAQTVAVYDLARFTGMRRSGIIGLCWQDLRLDDSTPHVVVRQDRAGQVKSTEHVVPLAPDAVHVLRELMSRGPKGSTASDQIFTIDARSFTQNLRRACDRAGIPPDERATLHQQRHEFVSRARETGVPDAVIREAIGHRDARALQGYTKVDLEVAGRLLSAAMPSTSSLGDAGDGVRG